MCHRCGYEAKTPYKVKRHLEKVKICTPFLRNISREEAKEIIMNSVKRKRGPNNKSKSKNLSTKKSEIVKFKKALKKLEEDNKCLNNHINSLKEMNSKLCNNVSTLIDKVGTNNITNNNTINTINTINNATINIVINNYGNEDKSYITKQFVEMLLKQPVNNTVLKMLKHIHFNPDHPENMNVRITDVSRPYARVYNDKKWMILSRKDVIEDMVKRSKDIIDEKSDNNEVNKKFTQQYEKNMRNLHTNADLLVINESEKLSK